MANAMSEREGGLRIAACHAALVLAAILTALMLMFAASAPAYAQQRGGAMEGALRAESFSVSAPSLADLSAGRSEGRWTCPVEPGTYRIQSTLSGTFELAVAGGSKKAGANVQLGKASRSRTQEWLLTVDAAGSCTLRNVRSSKVLGIAGSKARNGANVCQQVEGSSELQHWVVKKKGKGFVLLAASNPKYALDVAGDSASDGSDVQVRRYDGIKAQRWWLIPDEPDVANGRTIEDGVYELRFAEKRSYVLDVDGASIKSGATVQLYRRNSTLAQRWSFELQDDGFYTVVNVASGKALGVKGDLAAVRMSVQQRANSKSPFQRWAVTAGQSGTYYLVNKATGLALGVAGKAKNGVRTRTHLASGSSAQRFVFKRVNVLPSGAYVVYSALAPTEQAIDVSGASMRSGVRLQTYEANGTLAQRIYLRRAASGVYNLQPVCSGMYLTSERGKVVQRKRSGKDAQKWRTSVESGGVVFVNVATGKRLTVSGGVAENGAKLSTGKAASKASRFILEPCELIPDGSYVIRNAAAGKALDIDGSSIASGANAMVYTVHYGGNQAFTFKGKGGNVYDIRNAFSKKALDVSGASTAEGANVQQWEPNGTDAQRWKVSLDANGKLKLKNLASGKVLTAAGKGGQGANVVSRSDKRSKTQRWNVEYSGYELDKPLRRAAVMAENLSSDTAYLIMVDVTNNRTVVFKGYKGYWSVLKNWVVSTGAPSTPTVLGHYLVAMRGYSFGSGYTCYYWTQFYGDFLFHSILYDEGTFNVQDGRLGYSISHGCVRMNINDAKWIYDNIPSGTHVYTYK